MEIQIGFALPGFNPGMHLIVFVRKKRTGFKLPLQWHGNEMTTLAGVHAVDKLDRFIGIAFGESRRARPHSTPP
jgi:hypothetical protein